MAESNEIQALGKISTEVDEYQIKVTLATQCIKGKSITYISRYNRSMMYYIFFAMQLGRQVPMILFIK